jgi:hypothetical protein
MSAQRVWNRICAYRKSQADTIEAKYGQSALKKILVVLSDYPDIEAYHGHEKGKAGFDENAGLTAQLDKAIKWLMERVPATVETEKRGPDPVKKALGEKAEAILLAMIPEPGPKAKMGDLSIRLAVIDPLWTTKRNVKGKYNILAKSLNKALV